MDGAAVFLPESEVEVIRMRATIAMALLTLGLAACVSVEKSPPPNTTVVVPPNTTVVCPAGETC